jgi:hypothetical protein
VTQTHRRHGDLISLLSLSSIKESTLKSLSKNFHFKADGMNFFIVAMGRVSIFNFSYLLPRFCSNLPFFQLKRTDFSFVLPAALSSLLLTRLDFGISFFFLSVRPSLALRAADYRLDSGSGDNLIASGLNFRERGNSLSSAR